MPVVTRSQTECLNYPITWTHTNNSFTITNSFLNEYSNSAPYYWLYPATSIIEELPTLCIKQTINNWYIHKFYFMHVRYTINSIVVLSGITY